MSSLKLNIGSGRLGADSLWADWVNVDFAAFEADKGDWTLAEYLSFDVRNMWPLENEVADCIFASHIFEHVEYNKLEHFIGECFRVLKPGAPIRMICPDPRAFIRNWQINNKQFILDCYGEENWRRFEYGAKPHRGFTEMFVGPNYSHVMCSSIDLTMIHMIFAGFTSVQEMNYSNTAFPQFYGTDQEDEWPKTMDNRPIMSWYLEAVK